VKGKKLPPFGAELAARLRHDNLPLWVFVFCGKGAWARAKHPDVRRGDCCPLVWDGANPKAVRWPVAGCHVLIEIDTGPSPAQVCALGRELFFAGAVGILAWWLDWGDSRPLIWLPDGTVRPLTADEISRTLWPEEHARRAEAGNG